MGTFPSLGFKPAEITAPGMTVFVPSIRQSGFESQLFYLLSSNLTLEEKLFSSLSSVSHL